MVAETVGKGDSVGSDVARTASTMRGSSWFAILGVPLVFGTLWFFILTGDIRVLMLPLGLGMALLALWMAFWVAQDAKRQGMPAVPWAVVAFFLFVLGLVIYLVVREFRPGRPAG